MNMRYFVLIMALLSSAGLVEAAQGVGRIVRIPTPINARCINAKTDEITMTLRYVKTQKTRGFFTSDNKAGVTVITTLNSDGNPKAENPSVNLVSIQDAQAGQIYIPLEYPIASLLPLSPDSGRTFTKNVLLELYLDKTRGNNSFGTVLDIAGQLLGKLPIPANPYTNAVSQVVNFATSSIAKETTDAGGQLVANVTLQFNDRDLPMGQCNDFQSTGAIAIVGARGQNGVSPLPLDRLNSDYCWSFVADTTFEIQYAARPAGGCSDVPRGAYRDIPNDYIMIVLSAATILPPAPLHNVFSEDVGGGVPHGPSALSRRQQDLQESGKLCNALKLNPVYCGVQ